MRIPEIWQGGGSEANGKKLLHAILSLIGTEYD
jgi:hypothetical protein